MKTVVLGLTGGIASGKSTVSKMLRVLGAGIIDVDVIAREVVAPGTEGLAAVAREFGAECIRQDGTLDRAYLGRLVFASEDKRLRMNELLHPLIKQGMVERIEAFKVRGVGVIVVDAALLIEANLTSLTDCVWLIVADEQARAERIMARDSLTLEHAYERIRSQLSDEAKRKYADVVIENEGSLDSLAESVEREWFALRARFGIEDEYEFKGS